MNIAIEWLYDDYDCDDCGPSFAEGAIVHFDGDCVLSLIPSAHCFGGESWDRDTVYSLIFKELGHTLND